jgi:ferrous iron transport protein A
VCKNDRCHASPSKLAKPNFGCYYELLAMPSPPTIALGEARVVFRGRIHQLSVNGAGTGLPGPELERRLIELGFVEGAVVELLHQGLFGGDPIAVRVADTTIALRRREAMAILVTVSS